MWAKSDCICSNCASVLTLATRTPEGLKAEYPNSLDVVKWINGFEDTWLKGGFDANNWIWQTWAYDRHDVGTTPGFNGDTVKALRKAFIGSSISA